jgi:hypothetical protein
MEFPKLTTQAQYALFGYILVLIAIFLPAKPTSPEETARGYDLSNRLMAFIILLLPIALSVYTINCLVAGQCSIWSWVNAILVFVWSLLIFGVSIYAMFVKVPVNGVAASQKEAIASQ